MKGNLHCIARMKPNFHDFFRVDLFYDLIDFLLPNFLSRTCWDTLYQEHIIVIFRGNHRNPVPSCLQWESGFSPRRWNSIWGVCKCLLDVSIWSSTTTHSSLQSRPLHHRLCRIHGVAGVVHAADNSTLIVGNFSYDEAKVMRISHHHLGVNGALIMCFLN